jgi:hypothetical protein
VLAVAHLAPIDHGGATTIRCNRSMEDDIEHGDGVDTQA